MSHRVSAKYCGVPKCSNSSIKTAHKFFFSSPENMIRRKRWLNAMGLSLKHYSEKTRFFVCEDHFDLPNDLQDYGKFLHGKDFFKQHKLKLDVLPHIFNDRKDNNTVKRKPAQKTSPDRARKSIVEEFCNPLDEQPTLIQLEDQSMLNPLEEQSNQTDPLEEKSMQTEDLKFIETELDLTEEKCLPTELVVIKSEKEDIEMEEKYLPTEPSEKSDAETNSTEPLNFFQITLRSDGDITCTCDTGPCDRTETHDKGSQCYFTPDKPKIRSKGIQTSNKYYTRDVALSPIRFDDIEDK